MDSNAPPGSTQERHPGPRTGGGGGNGEAAAADDAELRAAWLARCLPVVAQPEHDIAAGFSLTRVFATFRADAACGETLCELVLAYKGEASYSRTDPYNVNHFATLFYLSFNRLVFGRTADLDYVTLTDVRLHETAAGSRPWRSLRTRDHAGTQTWSQGNKGNLLNWLSLFYHYREDIPYDVCQWRGLNNGVLTLSCLEERVQKIGDRPIIYVNTANHLMGERNNNPGLPLRLWSDYVIMDGGVEEAEAFAHNHIPQKPVLWAPWHGSCGWPPIARPRQKACRAACCRKHLT
eukprot:SM000020S06041  [mRNA]  locus=s20:648361:650035:+ [translate_table: standard]